jgi:hypothetical protein
MLQPTGPLQHRRRRLNVLAMVAWLAGLVAVAGVAVVGRDNGTGRTTTNPGAVPATPATRATPGPTAPPTAPEGEPNARIPVVHGPMGVAVGAGSVWVVTAADLRLRRIDPATNAVTVIDLPFVPASPNATPLPTASGETAFATIRGGTSPAGHDLLPLVAIGGRSVWVLGAPAPNVLIRVDPAAGRVVSAIRLPAPGTGVVSGPAGTWVTTDAGLLVGIDTRRDKLGPIVRLGRGRIAAAAGTDATWVSAADGRVVRLDTRGRVTATNDGLGGGPIATSAHRWLGSGMPSGVADDYGDTVARVAPREAWVAETARTRWLCRPDLGELWRTEQPA